MSDILGIMEIAFKVHRNSRFELFSTVLSFGSSLSLILGAAKGQLISKANCQGREFSQKTNENTSHTSKNEFIRSFFGRILGQKKNVSRLPDL